MINIIVTKDSRFVIHSTFAISINHHLWQVTHNPKRFPGGTCFTTLQIPPRHKSVNRPGWHVQRGINWILLLINSALIYQMNNLLSASLLISRTKISAPGPRTISRITSWCVAVMLAYCVYVLNIHTWGVRGETTKGPTIPNTITQQQRRSPESPPAGQQVINDQHTLRFGCICVFCVLFNFLSRRDTVSIWRHLAYTLQPQ